MNISDIIKGHALIFDGAMGTMLQKFGLPGGVLPETYNITHPEVVTNIHRQYVMSGSEVISANTFQSNRLKLKASGYSVDKIISAAISCARESGAKYVALDIGPLGELLEPIGGLPFEEAVQIFAEQASAGEKYGADLIILETFSDLYEIKAAILAAKESTSLPVIASMTFQSGGTTFMGCDAKAAAVTLSAFGVDALGANCSLGPNDLSPIVEELLAYSSVPVIVQANAGLPTVVNGAATYNISPCEYSVPVADLVKKGVRIVGGCCGTDPEYISELKKAISNFPFEPFTAPKYTVASTGFRTVFLNDRLTLIGDNINTCERTDLAEAVIKGDMETLAYEAADQADAGCDMLNVKISELETGGAEKMLLSIKAIQSMTRLPLVIDSSDPLVLEAAARIYNGRPVLNSVNGSGRSMEAIFPIAKKYGALLIGLTIDENGTPLTSQKHCEIAEKILSRAADYGIGRNDIIINCFDDIAVSEQELAAALQAIRLIKRNLGVKTAIRISGVSDKFLADALEAGVDAVFLDPILKSDIITSRLENR